MPHTPDAPGAVPVDEATGPVPVGNAPGHHPDVEQDKPIGRRPRPRSVVESETGTTSTDETAPTTDHTTERSTERATGPATERFDFEFSGPTGVAARAFTLTEDRAYVEVGDGSITARYGPWTIATTLDNIAEVSLTGPFKIWKVAGPPHLSFVDRGLTFATNAERGVCIRFHEPVPGIEPTGHVRHPGLTVTVADPEGLVAALAAA